MARYFETLFRYWVRFSILLLVLPLAIVAGSIFVIRTYTASASIWVEDPSSFGISTAAAGWNQYLTPAQNQQDSINQMLHTKSFVGQIGDDLLKTGVATPSQITSALNSVPSQLTVTSSGSHLLIIAFSCDHAGLCVAVIKDVIDLYRQRLAQLDQDQASLASTFFTEQLASAQHQLQSSQAALQTYLASHPGQTLIDAPNYPQLDALSRQINSDQQSVDSLQQQVHQLQFTSAEATQFVNAVSNVVDAPSLAGGRLAEIRSSLKRVLLPLAASVAAGLAYLALLTALDNTVRDPQELEHRVKLPVLATIPHFSRMKRA